MLTERTVLSPLLWAFASSVCIASPRPHATLAQASARTGEARARAAPPFARWPPVNLPSHRAHTLLAAGSCPQPHPSLSLVPAGLCRSSMNAAAFGPARLPTCPCCTHIPANADLRHPRGGGGGGLFDPLGGAVRSLGWQSTRSTDCGTWTVADCRPPCTATAQPS